MASTALLDDLDNLLINQVNNVMQTIPNHRGRDILKFLHSPCEIPSLVDAVETLIGTPLFDGNQLKRKFLIEALQSLQQQVSIPLFFDAQDENDITYFELKTAAPFKDVLDLPNPTKALRLMQLREHEEPFNRHIYLRLIHMVKRGVGRAGPQPLFTSVPYVSDEGVQPGGSYASALNTAINPVPMPAPKPIKPARCPDKALCMKGSECKLGHVQEERKFFIIRDRAIETGFDGCFVKTSYCAHWQSNKCRRDKTCCFFAHGDADTLCRECKTFGSCTC